MDLLPVIVFVAFVLIVLGLSFYLSSTAKSASGYFSAGGRIHWSVNGIAFAGDYLSAASFLGIAGMIATLGYDGFLYSIGYLAGWVVALFVVAEPMKRLGRFTFTDALDANFNSRGIQLAAAISTLIVSIFYLIPQMVGAGVLVTPLLGLPHYMGVIMVGGIVILIVATAGMASTTYVQFLKGTLLIIFSAVLVIAVLGRGLTTTPDHDGRADFYEYGTLAASQSGDQIVVQDPNYQVAARHEVRDQHGTTVATLVKLQKDGAASWWKVQEGNSIHLEESQWVIDEPDGGRIINGAPASSGNQLRPIGNLTQIEGRTGPDVETGPTGPFAFLSKIADQATTVKLWKQASFQDGEAQVTVYYPTEVEGSRIARPGLKYKVEGSILERLDFISLMMALFFGTAALPHILIRYYTVPNPAAARKSTIVAIAAIGLFYILTLYMGLGAMVNGVINPADNNMSAPLLARSFGSLLFAVISAIAFATVLGTVSGLICAASGAIAHDLLNRFGKLNLSDSQQVGVGKLAAFSVGLIAIILGIVFKGMNVSFLVGWAFAVAASANLPAITMMLFWKKTTSWGIVASIAVGIVASIGVILLSPDMYVRYGLPATAAPMPFSNPGIISIPLSFVTLVVVSLLTQKRKPAPQAAT